MTKKMEQLKKIERQEEQERREEERQSRKRREEAKKARQEAEEKRKEKEEQERREQEEKENRHALFCNIIQYENAEAEKTAAELKRLERVAGSLKTLEGAKELAEAIGETIEQINRERDHLSQAQGKADRIRTDALHMIENETDADPVELFHIIKTAQQTRRKIKGERYKVTNFKHQLRELEQIKADIAAILEREAEDEAQRSNRAAQIKSIKAEAVKAIEGIKRQREAAERRREAPGVYKLRELKDLYSETIEY